MPSAPLYGTMKGDRATGYQGHRELVIQGQTHKGLIRVIIDKDGAFSVYIGEPDITTAGYGATNCTRVGTGNLDALSYTEDNTAAGDLPPIPVENRHVASLRKAAKAGATTHTVTPGVKNVRVCPNCGTVNGAIAVACGKCGTKLDGGTATTATAVPDKPRRTGEVAFKVEDFPIGTVVTEPSATNTEPNEQGTVMDNGSDAAGPYVLVEYPEVGEIIYRPDNKECARIVAAESSPTGEDGSTDKDDNAEWNEDDK